MGRSSTWTEEQCRKALKMYADNIRVPDIALAVGKNSKTVWSFLRYRNMTPEQRAERIAARRAIYASTGRPRGRPANENSPLHGRPTVEMLLERDYRETLPHRDLTAAFCGDPKPGFSMLERRP